MTNRVSKGQGAGSLGQGAWKTCYIKMITRIEEAQIINSIKSSGKELGLLINFGELSLNWKRYIYTDKY